MLGHPNFFEQRSVAQRKCGPLHTTIQSFPRPRTDPEDTDAPSAFTRLLRGDPRRCVGVAGAFARAEGAPAFKYA